MVEKQKRRRFRFPNRFERVLLVPFVLSTCTLSVLVVLLLWAIVTLVVASASNAPSPFQLSTVSWASIVILLIVLCCDFLLLRWMYRVSYRMVAPLDRISRELDQIHEGTRERRPLTLRQGDYLFELVEKIDRVLRGE
jgi:sensor histidine kinase YesM